MNLVDLVKGQLGGDMVGKIAGMLGESPDKAKGALDAAIPSVLAGLAHTASTGDGAKKLLGALGEHDDGLLGNLGGMLSGAGGNALANKGGGLLGSLLGGGMMGNLGGVLSKFTGLSSGTVTTLLGVVAPLIMGVLKKNAGGLDAGGLSSLLASQKGNIAAAMPAGLGSMLGSIPGLGSMASAAGAVAGAGRQAVGAATHTAKQAGSPLKFLLPVVLLAALGYFAYTKYMKPTTPTPPATNPPAVNPTPKTDIKPLVSEAVGKMTGDLTGVFDGLTRTFSDVKDAASAEAALPKINEASTKIDGFLSAFKAFSAGDKTSIVSAITPMLGKLQPIIDKVIALPGVKEKIGPAVEAMLTKLKDFK